MEALNFYDMKAKKSFTTKDYKIEMRSGRKFAVAQAPSGAKAFRIMGK